MIGKTIGGRNNFNAMDGVQEFEVGIVSTPPPASRPPPQRVVASCSHTVVSRMDEACDSFPSPRILNASSRRAVILLLSHAWTTLATPSPPPRILNASSRRAVILLSHAWTTHATPSPPPASSTRRRVCRVVQSGGCGYERSSLAPHTMCLMYLMYLLPLI